MPFLGPLPRHMGCSQARGLIGAVATSLRQSHSNARSEPCLQLTLQLHGNARSLTDEARDRSRNLMVPNRIRFCCATMGTPIHFLMYQLICSLLMHVPQFMHSPADGQLDCFQFGVITNKDVVNFYAQM